jgi:hypothetical protein
MFLVKSILDSLVTGPKSERDLKAAVLDRCRTEGIKLSSRGTGLGE